jgi:uncharacterized protein
LKGYITAPALGPDTNLYLVPPLLGHNVGVCGAIAPVPEGPFGKRESKTMGQPVVHFEIGCRDIARTSSFYSDLFGWDIAQAGPAGMINTNSGAGITGHITALGHEPHNYVTVYVQVDDLKEYLSKAEALGGKTLVPPVEIPTGRFAWMADPDGNVVGLLQPKTPPVK